MTDIKNKETLKQLLKEIPYKCAIEDLLMVDSGLYDIEVNGIIFNCFLYKKKSNKLYVFLSAIGKDKVYPYFTRGSWPIWMDGNAICIDDPTRRDFNVAPGFFKGSSSNSYEDKLHKLIESVKSHLGIDNANVIFISSSNGGVCCD